MNELLLMLENFQLWIQFRDWVMNMSISNLIAFTLILYLSWTISMEASRTMTVNGVERKRVNKIPKYIFLGIVGYLMYLYPDNLWIACSVWLFVLASIWLFPAFVLMFIRLFTPRSF